MHHLIRGDIFAFDFIVKSESSLKGNNTNKTFEMMKKLILNGVLTLTLCLLPVKGMAYHVSVPFNFFQYVIKPFFAADEEEPFERDVACPSCGNDWWTIWHLGDYTITYRCEYCGYLMTYAIKQ